jgi:hypothetical protein
VADLACANRWLVARKVQYLNLFFSESNHLRVLSAIHKAYNIFHTSGRCTDLFGCGPSLEVEYTNLVISSCMQFCKRKTYDSRLVLVDNGDFCLGGDTPKMPGKFEESVF